MAREGLEAVDHPAHYGGADNVYEVIKVIEAWGLDKDFLLGNTVKYIPRAGKKGDQLEDLKKARWYLDRKIKNMENAVAKKGRKEKSAAQNDAARDRARANRKARRKKRRAHSRRVV